MKKYSGFPSALVGVGEDDDDVVTVTVTVGFGIQLIVKFALFARKLMAVGVGVVLTRHEHADE